MANKGVQYNGIPAILKLHDNLQLVAWSLKYDKGLNCKYPNKQTESPSIHESKALLENVLQSFSATSNYAVYTICFYEQVPKGGIKPSTEPDYTFNFTISDYEDYGNYQVNRSAGWRQMDERLRLLEEENKKLKQQVENYENDDDVEEIDNPVMGLLNGIVTDQRFKNRLTDIMFNLADKLFTPGTPGAKVYDMNNQYREPARVSGVSDTDPVVIDDVQTEKCRQAIEVLARVDPALGDNLMKIASMAKADKDKYFKAIGTLNLFL